MPAPPELLSYIDAHAEPFIARLAQAVAIPSISGDPAFRPVHQMSAWHPRRRHRAPVPLGTHGTSPSAPACCTALQARQVDRGGAWRHGACIPPEPSADSAPPLGCPPASAVSALVPADPRLIDTAPHAPLPETPAPLLCIVHVGLAVPRANRARSYPRCCWSVGGYTLPGHLERPPRAATSPVRPSVRGTPSASQVTSGRVTVARIGLMQCMGRSIRVELQHSPNAVDWRAWCGAASNLSPNESCQVA
ncbi:hypothetical protein C8R43DRAFT_1027528, partial [Mycena crocata]